MSFILLGLLILILFGCVDILFKKKREIQKLGKERSSLLKHKKKMESDLYSYREKMRTIKHVLEKLIK